MNISGVGNIGIYSSHGSGGSSSTIRSQASFSDSYSGSVNASLSSYDMFGNIRSNIFDSFLKEDSFKQAIQDVFEGIEEKIIDTDTLVETAKYSNTFSKFGEGITTSEDGKFVTIHNATNVYYNASNAKYVSIGQSRNVVIEANGGDKIVAASNNENTVISTGSGDDVITNGRNKNTVISSGSGDDLVTVGQSYNTSVDTGLGNDRVTVGQSNNTYVDTDLGDDNITVADSSNTEIKAGEGDDFIYNLRSENTLISSGVGADVVGISDSNNIVINTDSGNDIVSLNMSKGAKIDGGSGDDNIIAINSDNVNAQLGEGEDSFMGKGNNIIVDGGAGDDIINVSGSGLLISGGTGNDFISIKTGTNEDTAANTITYNLGDGMDTIDTHGGTNTINMNDINYEDVDITQESDDYGNYTVNIMLKDGSGGITLNAGSNADNSISFADQTINL